MFFNVSVTAGQSAQPEEGAAKQHKTTRVLLQ